MTPYQAAGGYLLTNLETALTYLFPGGKREGPNFVVGNIAGQPGRSFSIALEPQSKRGLYKDFANGERGSRNLPKLWKIVRGIPDDNHARFFQDLRSYSGHDFGWNFNGQSGGKRKSSSIGIDWQEWAGFSLDDAKRLAEHPKRQFQPATVQWLHEKGHVGLYKGRITFAMRDPEGNVTGVNRWFESEGKLKFIGSPALLVIGDPSVATILHIHKSVWDLIAMLDRTGWHLDPEILAFCTWGAGNSKLVKDRIPAQIEKIYLWEQREPPDPKTGISPNQTWQAKVVAALDGRSVYLVRMPESSGCKDLNDWTLFGATMQQLAFACDFAALYRGQAPQTKSPPSDFGSTPHEFPPPEERPCFRVYLSDIKINDRLFKAGLYSHSVTELGHKEYPEDTWICTPLLVKAKTATAKNRNYGRLLEYHSSNGIKRTWAMPMELLAGDGSPVLARLLDDGVEISHANRRKVLEYLSSEQPIDFLRCATRTGWHSPTTFVLPEEILIAKNGAPADKVWFQAATKTAEYLRGGNPQNWSKNVGARSSGNNYLLFAISFGLTGPLLFPLGLRGCGVHFYGDSSSGKTTALEIAASC